MFVIACFFLFVCLKFQIIRFVISALTPIFFIEISFIFTPPPPQEKASRRSSRNQTQCRDVLSELRELDVTIRDLSKKHEERGGGGGGKKKFLRESIPYHSLQFFTTLVPLLRRTEKLFEVVKTEKNKYLSSIQHTDQSFAELSEKLKILRNEVDILRSESSDKDKSLIVGQTLLLVVSLGQRMFCY